MAAAVFNSIQVDVVIVGGGVMGLFLLNDLKKEGYSAVLLERRELGGEQTCHSHVYLHEGYVYQESESEHLAKHLLEVKQLWDKWLGQSPNVALESSNSFFGYQQKAHADKIQIFWETLGLRSKRVRTLPQALNGSVMRHLLRSDERCLNGVDLVKSLRTPVDDSITQISDVERIDVDQSRAVTSIRAAAPDKSWSVMFEPKVLLLAAGSGNQSLLHRVTGGDSELLGRVQNFQQMRKSHMLVIQGSAKDLPPLTGVFPALHGLFIVSRTYEKDTIWLVSDFKSRSISFREDWLIYDYRWWLSTILRDLEKLAPQYLSTPSKLRWGIYEAPKAEAPSLGSLPQEYRIENFRLNNLLAVWPTKLTLAPKASADVVSRVRRLNLKQSPVSAPWKILRQQATVAPERWSITPRVSWDEFRRWHNL